MRLIRQFQLVIRMKQVSTWVFNLSQKKANSRRLGNLNRPSQITGYCKLQELWRVTKHSRLYDFWTVTLLSPPPTPFRI